MPAGRLLVVSKSSRPKGMPAGRLLNLVFSNCKTCCAAIMSMRVTKQLTFDIHKFKYIQNKIFAGELIIWDKAGPMVSDHIETLKIP